MKRVGKIVFLFAFICVAAAGIVTYQTYFSTAALLDQVESDWKDLRVALQEYGLDRCGIYFPPDTTERRTMNPEVFLTFETDTPYITNQPLGESGKPVTFWLALTTPIAYRGELPVDPFRPKHFYGYTCWNLHDPYKKALAVFYSPGPDGKEDLPLVEMREQIEAYLRQRSPSMMPSPEDYGVLREMIRPGLYDPDTGEGDLIWIVDGAGRAYGWRIEDPEWMKAPMPQLPPLQPPEQRQTLPQFVLNDPLPTPASMAELANSRELVAVPHEYWSVLQQFCSMGKDSQYGGRQIESRSFDVLRDRFGKDFMDFFLHPGPLTEREKENFRHWRHEQSRWWSLMELAFKFHPVQGSKISLEAMGLYESLVFYGKSQLLLAGYEASEEAEVAVERLDKLDAFLDFLSQNREVQFSFQQRVESELARLSGQLRQKIEKKPAVENATASL